MRGCNDSRDTEVLMNANTRKVLLFVVLTFAVSWSMVALFVASRGKWNTPTAMAVAVLYMFVPMTMALIIQKLVYREPVKEPLGISFRLNPWFLVAWLLPPGIAFATLGVSLLFPGVEYSPEMAGMFERMKAMLTPEQLQQMKTQAAALPIHPIWIGLIQGLMAGVSFNAVAGFGEELGWRGLLQKELGYLGFWRSATLIGVIWGVWHAPIVLQGHNYPEHPVAGVFMMIVWCVLLSPIFSYVRLRAKSVLAAAVIHGTLNATYGLSIMMIAGGNDLSVGVTGLAGFIVLLITNMGIFVYDQYLAKEPIMAT